MPPKRKRSSVTEATNANTLTSANTQKFSPIVLSGNSTTRKPPATNGQSSKRAKADTNPDQNSEVIDGKVAQRASPDADQKSESLDLSKVATAPPETLARNGKTNRVKKEREDSEILSEVDLDMIAGPATKKLNKSPKKSSIAAKKASDEIKAFKLGPIEDAELLKLEAARPPPVNSDYLPLPWKGRLGYACLNTYLRFSNPSVFSSRTCRIASILEHRHPLKDPTQPEHISNNRLDKPQPASVERGQRYVKELGLANSKGVVKIFKWNDKYGIKLAPFASETLAEVGRVASELGHRLSTHPGQFTQLGSPRKEVIDNAIRDLVCHYEMLSLLRLPAQMDRDAVMILHLGGIFGDKAVTLDRFRENYKNLSPSVKRRLVLENGDVSWSIHDLLPLCEELNIPLCLDFHHHNIIFDSAKLREGTLDIIELYPRIKATWGRKQIRQKMHYSEPCPEAITDHQRRKRNARPVTLPPCPSDMDLMIEAKDKEQAVFELMRIFKLPGWNTFNNIIPYERSDDNKPLPKEPKKKNTKKQITAEIEEFGKELSKEEEKHLVPEEDVGMGGKENRCIGR
ncbi:UV-endonuclease UvdE-domain-containing protein [Bisporella sp. PMI_857]|nr:UV-endonuclease UvdE-domain-containing protein [Bisporella sp. PMI_857]